MIVPGSIRSYVITTPTANTTWEIGFTPKNDKKSMSSLLQPPTRMS